MAVNPKLADKSLKITTTRIKSTLDKTGDFYWFYVSLKLEEKERGALYLRDLVLVEYHLLHKSFPEPDIRISNPKGGFEYRFWLYGFIKVSADIVTRKGEVLYIPSTNISWDVTSQEIKLNGKKELTWD